MEAPLWLENCCDLEENASISSCHAGLETLRPDVLILDDRWSRRSRDMMLP
mgnify:CR=1 FL=1